MVVTSLLPCPSLLQAPVASSPHASHGGSKQLQARSSFFSSPSTSPSCHGEPLPIQQAGPYGRSMVPSSSLHPRPRPMVSCCCSHSRENVSEEIIASESSSSEEEDDLSFSRRQLLGAAVLVADVPGLVQDAWAWTGAPAAAAVGGSGAKIPSVCPEGSTIKLSIGGKCGLGVSIYPDFVYNPEGGGGSGSAADVEGDRIGVRFDPSTLNIPSVQFATTSFLGLPLPPPLRIDIVSDELQGFIDRTTGKVELKFVAAFSFSAGPLYHAPPLLVNTVLTTERAEGTLRSAQGQRMDEYGRCRLVGVARIQPVDDVFMTNFLMLPTDVLAELPATFEIVPPKA